MVKIEIRVLKYYEEGDERQEDNRMKGKSHN
jgi:hypothetical protein